MIITNTDHIPGREIAECYGLVSGSSVRARAVGRDILAGIRSLFGGEIREYSDLQKHARDTATSRAIEKAKELGADAIVNLRYTSSDIASGISEILAYGTAVKLK